jgi:outer membrane protein
MKIVILVWFSLASAAASAAGISVTDAWRAALGHDPKFAAAQAQRDAGRARGAEGRALWLPTLSASGNAGRGDLDSRTAGAFFSAPGFGSTNGVDFRTSINAGTATRWVIVAEQPLLDAARLADYSAQKDAARIAESQYRAAEQELMLRSARAYFDVLNARAQLQTLVRLGAAAQKARAEAQARYDAGDIPVTDMREAQASADTIAVQELDARSAATLTEAAFADLTGLDAADLHALPESATAQMPDPDPLDAWTRRAIGGSPVLAIQHLALSAAKAQVNRYGALNSPRLSLIAQLGRDSWHGNGDYGSTDVTQRESSIGLQASIPLFTGGMRSAQHHEARALAQQAEAELTAADQQVRQQTRTAWLGLTTAAARVRALQRLKGSAASRRDATALGTEIGGRSALELLNAETDYQRAGADFQRAQSEWLLAALQLKAVAGELTAADLQQIDRRLDSVQPEAK